MNKTEEYTRMVNEGMRNIYPQTTATIDPKFKPGDVVRLKSGGPSMTVETCEVTGDRVLCVCRWFHQGLLAMCQVHEGELKKVRLWMEWLGL